MTDSILGQASRRRFAHGSAAAFVVLVSGVSLTFLSQLVIARTLGPESFGIYAYVLAWMSVLAYGCALGFNVSLLRFVPVYETSHSWALMRGVLRYSERRVALVGVFIIIAGMVSVSLWADSGAQEQRTTFLVGFLIVPVWALLWLRSATVRAFGGVVSALVPEKILRVGLLLSFVLIASMGLGWSLDASTVMWAMVVSTALGLVVASIAMHRLRPPAMGSIDPAYDAQAWRKAAVPLLVVAAMDALFNRTGVLLLGWLGETKYAGIYGLAFSIALLLMLPRTAVATLFSPAISRFHAQGQMIELQALLVRGSAWSLGAACGIALVLGVMAEYVLSWFGPEFVAGSDVLRVLLIGQVLSASAGFQWQVLAMTGHERNLAVLLTLTAGFNLVLSCALIIQFGLMGAAWGMTVGLVVWEIVMAKFIRTRLGLLPGVYGALR